MSAPSSNAAPPLPAPDDEAITDGTTSRRSRADRRRAERRARWRRAGLAAVAVGAIAGIATYAVRQAGASDQVPAHRAASTPTATAGARISDPARAIAFAAGAGSDIAAVTTYDYRSLEDALSNGLAVTTGRYRDAYRTAMTGGLAAGARHDRTVQTFDVLRVGIGEITGDGRRAKVLIFGVEHISYAGGAADAVPVTLCATIRHAGSRYLISDLVEDANAGLPPGTTELPVAAEAARREVVNLLSYRRARFSADYARALAGATGELRTQITRNADDTRASISKGRYDLKGAVTAVAAERARIDSVTMLVAATSSRIDDRGHETTSTLARYEVTVDEVGGAWVTSSVRAVGSA